MSFDERELRAIQLTPGDGFPPTEDATPVLPDPIPYDDLCRQVRMAYIMCRREHSGDPNYGEKGLGRWDGNDPYGHDVNPIWRSVTKHIVGLGADPLTFVRAQFANARRDRPPMPNQLTGESSVAKYERFIRDTETELRQKLERELASIRSMVAGLETALNWEYGRALRYALFNYAEVTAGSVLRYALALEYELADVAEHFREQAVLQYAFQKPFYDRAWDGCIPDQLSREGQRLVERALM